MEEVNKAEESQLQRIVAQIVAGCASEEVKTDNKAEEFFKKFDTKASTLDVFSDLGKMLKFSLKDQLNRMVAANNGIAISVASYDGGNDSGGINSINITLDFPDDFTEEDFYDFLNTNLGYGSWAGDFYAYGEIFWNGSNFYVEGHEEVRNYVNADIPNFTFDK